MNEELARFENYLRNSGLKVTRARQRIFREIAASPGVHPNAEEIHRRLRAKKTPVGLATIYRTLNLLVRGGLVTAVDLGEGHSHFEPEWNRASHGHLICLSCGQIQEFSHTDIQEAIRRIGTEKGYRLDKFSIQVFGRCRGCTAKLRRPHKT